LERLFGEPLGGVSVVLGVPAPGGRPAARAATRESRLEIAGRAPPLSLMAHEMTHVLQARRGGAGSVDGRAALEAEARRVAMDASAGRAAVQGRAPAVWLFDTPPRRRGATELRRALTPDPFKGLDLGEVLAILKENANPPDMAQLRADYGPRFFPDLKSALGDSDWGTARGYLGAQLTLAENIQTRTGILIHDQIGIMETLERWPDADVLRMIEESAGVPAPAAAAVPAVNPPAAPPRASWTDVQAAIAGAMDADGQYRATQLLLGKAERARAARPALPPGSPAPIDAVARQRVAYAYTRISAAEAAGRVRDAYLAIADLNAAQRHELRVRLNGGAWPRLGATIGDLRAITAEPDDATALERALRGAGSGTGDLSAAMLEHAAGRVGAMIAQARARLDALPPASSEERNRRTAELAALEQRFHEQGLVQSLYFAAHETGEATLAGLGASAEQTAQFTVNKVANFTELLAWMRRIPAARRLTVTQSPWYQSKVTQVMGINPSPAQQNLLLAALYEGNQELANTDFLKDQQALLDAYDIEQSWERGESARVWSLLLRMPAERRQRLANLMAAPPAPDDKRPRPPLIDLLRRLERGTVTETIQGLRLRRGLAGEAATLLREDATTWVVRDGRPTLRVADPRAFIEVIARSPEAQAELRRGMVIRRRLDADPTLEVTPADRALAERFVAARQAAEEIGDRDHDLRAAFEAVAFGDPDVLGTTPGPQDPTSEADFMHFRLEDRLTALRPSASAVSDLLSWAGPTVDENATQFRVLYDRVRPGGVGRAELAQLADLYHRTLRALEVFAPTNRAFASTAGMLVAAVVGTVVVTALSGGTLGPVAIAALAGFAGGAAAGLTGAAIRGESTDAEVLTDVSTGAVEGAVAVASAALAAELVHGATAGRAAGQAARAAGGQAVRTATGGLGAAMAEGAIDGAIGGAAGELFQTAIDEATWNRGVAAAIAALLAALARGASMGAAGGALGGAIGHAVQRMVTRLGGQEAEALGRLLADAGVQHPEALSDDALAAIQAASRQAATGDIDGAQAALRRVGGLAAADAEALNSALRRLHLVRTGLDIGERDASVLARQVVEVDEQEFLSHAADPRAHAVFAIENGSPRVYVRRGSPPTAVREEIQHLMQWQQDPLMRERMTRVMAVDDTTWRGMGPADRARLAREHLIVEADAQRGILRDVEVRARAGDALAEGEWLAADDNLFLINRRIEELDRALLKPESIDARGLRLDDPSPPRFYARGTAAKPVEANLTTAQEKILAGFEGKLPGEVEAKLQTAGYSIHRDQGGRIIRIQRPPGAPEGVLPHLSIGPDGLITRGRGGVRNHEDLRRDAALAWQAEQEGLGRQRAAIAAGRLTGTDLVNAQRLLKSPFRTHLEGLVKDGAMGPADAGLLLGWAGFVEELVNRSQRSIPQLNAVRGLPRGVGGMTDGALSSFRGALRAEAADVAAAVGDGAQRMETLQALLAALPDNRSRGELFTEFRKAMWRAEGGIEVGLPVEPFRHPEFATTTAKRTPDDVVRQKADVPGWLPKGRFAVEDKTGPGAFVLEQMRDYARTAAPGRGLRLAPDAAKASDYDGLIIMFSSAEDAGKALKQMREDPLIRPLLGRHPGGIHVGAYDAKGARQLLTPSPAASAVPIP
jgi:hypothetical protein